MKNLKKITTLLLCIILILCAFPLSAFADDADPIIAADWQFDEGAVVSNPGEKLRLDDASGNGNILELSGSKKYIEFSDEEMYDDGMGTGSLDFKSEQKRIMGKGSEFITAKDAPINKEAFENGYTIELIYQLPENFAADDSWMGLLARKGKCTTQNETKGCTMSVAVSNCKEIQFTTANKDDNHEMDSAWSLTMDKGGLWYHVVIVSDGKVITTYVNGCESFRTYESEEMKGMYADPKDGRFVIGGYDNGLFNHHARGKIQQIRIARKALSQDEWLISDHENYMESFGEDIPFTSLSSSSYNVVFLPDIQNATEYRPNVLYTAAQWLNDNKSLVNPKAIISLGDSINEYDDEAQWANAREFYSILEENGAPILQQPGNHDYGEAYYLDSFGPESDFGKRQQDREVMYSPSGYSSCMTFDGGSYKYFVINISMFHIADQNERDWFESKLKEYSSYPTIVTSHNFQDADAAKPNLVNLSGLGKSVWEIVKKYDQVFLMISGHNHGAGEEVLKNDVGNEVYSVMADYQFMHNGGDAFFKFFEFDEAHNKIRLSTFSPYAVTLPESERTFFDVNYMTGAGNYTILDFDFESRFPKDAPASSDAENYKAILEEAKTTETDVKELGFDGTVTLSAADAHEVSTKAAISPLNIALVVGAIVLVLIAIIVTVVLVVKKRKKEKNYAKKITE